MDSGPTSILGRRRDSTNINNFEEDPDLIGVVLHPEHNDIELDGNSSVLEVYDDNGRVSTTTNGGEGGASLRDFSVVLMSTSRIGRGAEVFVGYDLPDEDGSDKDVSSTTVTVGDAKEEKVAALYRFGFL